MTKMIREIHPVGQGAFYTENFTSDNFMVAYDCGSYADGLSMPRKTPDNLVHIIDEVIDDCKVDILFVSHFHLDHINGIEYLLSKNNKRIKIVLPRISLNLQALYLVSMALEDAGTLSSYTSISAFMRHLWGHGENQDDIIFVEGIEGDNLGNELDIRKIQGHIKSGDILSLNNKWMYVPIVYIARDLEDLACKFKMQIEGEGIVFNDGFLKVKNDKEWKKVVSIYKKVVNYKSSLENNASLIVYSGPIHKARVMREIVNESITPTYDMDYMFWTQRMHRYNRHSDHHSGALYVGDMEDKKAWDEIYKKLTNVKDDIHISVLNTIGLVQISHHGSMNEFNRILSEELEASRAFCCYGSENKYKHPSYLTFRQFLRHGYEVFPNDEDAFGIRDYLMID